LGLQELFDNFCYTPVIIVIALLYTSGNERFGLIRG